MTSATANDRTHHQQEELPLGLQPTTKQRSFSRDEMNLAEFPLTVLSTRVSSSAKTLEFKDTIRGKNGELLERKWIITGADKFGLPTASDDEVLLGLMKLTVDAEFQDRKVYFTRYELLRALRWAPEGRNYSRLQKALDRLSGVRIKAANAFYDNESKSHSTRNFGIIDAYELNDARDQEPKPSYFIWSEALYKSFQVGFIKKLDLDFYLSLRSAVAKRLYRYLDKHFWYRSQVRINLFVLSHEKIGISRNYTFASSLKQQLDPAIEELVATGMLQSGYYEGRGSETEVVFLAKAGKPRVTAGKEQQRDEPAQAAERGSSTDLTDMLLERGLRETQVQKLLKDRSPVQLERVRKIVEHFDELIARQSKLVSKSPVGFLYRALENIDTFVLPRDPKAPPAQGELRLQAATTPKVEKLHRVDPSEEARYLVERRREIDRLRSEEVESLTLQKMEHEVESALSKMRAILSGERFSEVVRHGVDEKLAKLYALPNFDEWRRGQAGFRKPA